MSTTETKLDATPAMKACTIARRRTAQTFAERTAEPITLDEAKILALGAKDPHWRNIGLSTLMSYAIKRKSDELWDLVAELVNKIPRDERPIGILEYMGAWTTIGKDGRWARDLAKKLRKELAEKLGVDERGNPLSEPMSEAELIAALQSDRDGSPTLN